MILPDLSARAREPELMDEPDLDRSVHDQALDALARVNALSFTVGRVWREIERVAESRGAGRVRILDVACGGGDVLIALARRAKRAGVQLEAHGCDVSPTALERGRSLAADAHVDVRFFTVDVERDGVPAGYDVVASTLFLHHLDEDAAVGFLRALAESASTVMVQDLLRTRLGWLLAWGTLRVISRSHVAHVDGPRSVRAAFTVPEVRALAARAGWERAVVRRAWPERFTLLRRLDHVA